MDSIILFRRRTFGVDEGDDGVDFANGGTSENRRVKLGAGVERNNELTFNLSMFLVVRTESLGFQKKILVELMKMIEYETIRNICLW